MALRQLAFDLPHRAALDREDFLVSESNAAAVALIDSWPQWPSTALMIVGPAGCGKSHLVEVWRKTSRAQIATTLRIEDVPQLVSHGAVAIEDLPGRALDERALFHLLNLSRETRAHVLLTAREEPAHWRIGLADLASRLRSLPVARIGEADDALLRGVLLKQFADRQVAIDEPLLAYLVHRLPRSLETVRFAVGEIDRLALEQKSPVSRAFAAKVLPQIIENAELNLFIE
jgi:chromosomal replication initiation ATPase DnaA